MLMYAVAAAALDGAQPLAPSVTLQFHTGKDAWPDSDPRFRAAVTDAATSGANFAGEFAIAQVSCGSGCAYIAVVNEKTGVV